MSKLRKFKKLATIGSLVALTALASPKETKADIEFSPRLGIQFSQAEEVVDKDYSAGIAAGIDAKFLLNPQLSFDMGLSYYNSPGDSYSASEREWFHTTSESYSESFDELSFNAGGTLYLRKFKSQICPYIGAGYKASIFSETESYSSSGYRESSLDSDTDVTGIATGPYFKVGFNIPFKDNSFFIEGEYRNTKNGERKYPGLAIFGGVNFNLDKQLNQRKP